MPQKLHVVRKAVEGLSDAQIERLTDFGKRKADLIAEMNAAERAGDRTLASQIAIALGELENQLSNPAPRAPLRAVVRWTRSNRERRES